MLAKKQWGMENITIEFIVQCSASGAGPVGNANGINNRKNSNGRKMK